MKNRQKKITRKTKATSADILDFPLQQFAFERTLQPIEPKNEHQAEYQNAMRENPQTVVMGPAGTGKTFLAASYAADLLRQRQIKKIIITRPNVPGGRSLGFFPGDMYEKFAPWAAQIIADVESRMGKNAFQIALKNKDIELIPFEVMRGRSWDDAFILLDEAQNTTVQEMKMFLTRQGENSKVVINGDISQSDLKESSGLAQMIGLIDKYRLEIPVVEFDLDDIVRSDICATWVRAFYNEKL